MNQESATAIYWGSPYQKEIIAKITNVKGSEVQLSQTFFYPGGGGQLHDKGRLQYLDTEFSIVEVYKKDEETWHKIKKDKDIQFEVGTEVLLKLDWERRYEFMKAHTSQHLLTHILMKKYDCRTLKANFEEGKVEIEIDKKLNLSEIFDAIKEENNSINHFAN